ncbi:MAG: radical SAM protein [Candidatus Odinarchaeota archaeon]
MEIIRVRNEKYGGSFFNQANGDFLRFNHAVLEAIAKQTIQEPLDEEEGVMLSQFFPGISERNHKVEFLVKERLFSPYELPLVSEGPEFVDLSLLNTCNLSCSFCYTSSKKNGIMLSLDDYYLVMDQLAENRVYQVAIGGGEPTLHPEFAEMLKIMREQYSIVPNYTTNASLLTPELVKLSADLCGAVAISYHHHREDELLEKMRLLADYNVNAVLHVIADRSTLSRYAEIAEKFGKAGMRAIAFLLFKPVGRGEQLKTSILRTEDIKEIDRQFKAVFELSREYGFTVGFDTCFAPFLTTFDRCVKGTYDSCTGARFSAYIDWNLDVRPCSFIQEGGENLREKSLRDIWWGNYFNEFRKNLLKAHHSSCKKCPDFLFCFGGCPFLPEIVLCEKKHC